MTIAYGCTIIGILILSAYLVIGGFDYIKKRFFPTPSLVDKVEKVIEKERNEELDTARKKANENAKATGQDVADIINAHTLPKGKP